MRIEAIGLTKAYGGKRAVDRLSFCVEPGKVTGFLDTKAFHPRRSARDHLWMLAAAGHLPGDARGRIPGRRVDEVLGQVGLDAVAHRPAGGFSMGMAQRLGLAAALLAGPRALLLDEPANGLDPTGWPGCGSCCAPSPPGAEPCSSPATSWPSCSCWPTTSW